MTNPHGSGGVDPASVPTPPPASPPGQGPRPAVNPNAARPNQGLPNPGLPNPGLPNPGLPNPGLPNAGNPNAGTPNPGDPNAGHPNGAPTAPDQSRATQVSGAAHIWASQNPDAEAERAREREKSLSGDVADSDRQPAAVGNAASYVTLRGRGGSTIRAYRLPSEEITQPFAPPSGYAALEAAKSQGRKLIVVRGPEGVGKWAALVHAVTRGDGTSVVMRLSADDLRTLDPAGLPDCQAILLEDLTKEHLDQLDPFTVGQLSAALAATDTWLGLTVVDVPIPSSLDASVVALGDPPPARTVFELHLQTSSLGRQECADIVAKVADQLDDGPHALRRVAEAGRKLAEMGSVPDDVADFVREKLDARYECEQWFRALPDLRARCMALALAVFDRLPRERVASAADRLVELTGARVRVRDPLAGDAGVSLRALRARTEPGTLFKTEGDVPAMVLRYNEPKYPHWILEYAWTELDTARPHIITWLRELGRDPNYDVRTAAALTVGVLSRTAFDFLYAQIIGAWAESENYLERESAMLALGPPSRDTSLRATIDNLVQSWIADDRPRLQATAARTFGTEGGRVRFLRSMRELTRLAEIDDIEVALAVADSLGDFVLHGTGPVAARVFSEVIGWISGKRRQLRLVGHLALLRLTYLRGMPDLLGGKDADQDRKLRPVPTLLILASRDDNASEAVVWMLADGLIASDVYLRMRDSLKSWADAVEAHPQAQMVLGEVVRRVATLNPRAAAAMRRETALSVFI